MTIRVYVQEQLMAQRLDIAIINHQPETVGHLSMAFREGGEHWEVITPDSYTEPPRPTLSLPLEAGPALLDALARHYHGAEDTRQLRHDYERERTRVDEQAKVLADVVRTLASGAAAR